MDVESLSARGACLTIYLPMESAASRVDTRVGRRAS
jgi:hypothetical protein